MNIKSLKRIERLNYLLGGVAVLASVFFLPQAQVFGLLIGATLGAVNFTIICRMVQKWLGEANEEDSHKNAMSGFFLIPKMTVLMGAVVASIYFLPISPGALAIGFSIFLISIAIETARSLTNMGEAENDEA